MNLLKTSGLTFIATVIKLFVGLVINKAISLFVGPSGLAVIGQFQNISQLAMVASQGAINKGVVKYTAEYSKNEEDLTTLLATAIKITIVCSIIVGVALILLSGYLSGEFLTNKNFAFIFVIFGFTIVFYSLNSLLLAILNGLKEIKQLILINVVQSLYSLVFTTVLIYFFGLKGALIALVTNQSIIFLYIIWKLRNHKVINLGLLKGVYNTAIAIKLRRFALMAITSAIAIPISHLVIRNYLVDNLGWEQAGYWQAIWYISTMYLMVVTTTLGVYFLPKLSEITDKKALRSELLNGYRIILPIVMLVSAAIFFLKDFIVYILFSDDFKPMRELFLWQLVGDVIKIAAWLLSYLMLAKAMAKSYMAVEVLFNVIFVFISIFMVNSYGLIGMTYAFATSYSIYFVTVLLLTKKEFI
ncbi:O-antigen translocase [Pseudoalteromonas sp. ACER1]|uniref:O-antigen translocase n=1 Tax=unclassified Pseudoalteromonas TaxID=194690 RepID=UPI001F1C9CC6|nr:MULTISPECIES: O-antigen translocase [unclassified Pseudoalteromonas]MCF2848675.1 O-antigen translocase [Pseudoalteromonas sp. PAST1]MCO7209684.1 O-antigen translocase [Pseudoalteromonas sp. ACER1]